MSETTLNCLNCGKPVKPKHRYCPRCGQSTKVARLSIQEVRKNLQKRILHAESGILHLTWALALRPGKVALEFVQGRRKKYYNPLKYLTLSAGISVFVNEYFHILENMNSQPNPVTEITTRNYNLIILLSVPISAFFAWLLFRKKGFNYAEHLTLQAYIGGFRTVFFLFIFTPLVVWFPEFYYRALTIYVLIWLVYLSWAMSQFLGGPNWLTVSKSFLVFLCNQIVISGGITVAIIIRQLW